MELDGLESKFESRSTLLILAICNKDMALKKMFYSYWRASFLLMVGLLAAIVASQESTSTSKTTIEPPFPSLFDQVLNGQLTSVKIVAESLDASSGLQTTTEYLDLNLARAAYVTRNKLEQGVILLDAIRDKSFSYKPYTCEVHSQRDLQVPGIRQWNTDLSFVTKGPGAGEDDGTSTDIEVNLRLFGVIGYWIFAWRRAKVYSNSAVVYSVSKNIYRVSHRWTAEDVDNKMHVELHFIDTSPSNSNEPSLSLEMIQLKESEGEQKVLVTYNILSIDYEISQDAYDSVLQVPVGYGCLDEIEEVEFDQKRGKSGRSVLPAFSLDRRKLSLEATATKFTESSRESSTISMELARISKTYLMVRIRDTRFDYKHVIDTNANVQYTIDSRRGTCKLEHYPELADSDDLCKFDVDFANQMTLKVSFEFLVDLFDEKMNFKLVKTTKQGAIDAKYAYFERTSIGLFGSDLRPTRIIRKFLLDKDEYKLQSVTLWTLNTDESRLEEMYYLNVIDFEPIDHAWPSISHVFDVSEECYLNNERMQNGRDYAWLEFTYPISSQESTTLAGYTDLLEKVLYKRYSSYLRWSRFRIPRVELEFDDDHFVLRLLALNNPPLDVMFEKQESSALIFKTDSDQRTYVPDINHCVELCRKQHCHAISYCESTHSCIFTSRQIVASSDTVKNAQCDTYYDLKPDTTYVNTLQQVISKNRHIDFSPVAVPKPPEELLLPLSESGVDPSTYSELLNSYVKELMIYLKKERPGLDGVSFVSKLNGLLTVLIPNKFDIEVDPLSEFDLTDSSGEDDEDDRLPAFHEGLSMFRYKLEMFDQVKQRDARLFKGLNYDQCALACTDSKCGSFSFCPSRSECLITNVNSTSVAQSSNLIEQDTDCFIMQRDFLRNFDAFENVFRPQVSKKKSVATSPSECALACVSEDSFRCLAFDYCEEPSVVSGKSSKSTCFYQATRHQTNIDSAPTNTRTPASSSEGTGCTHYSRSFLADFLHIEYRSIDEKVKTQLRSSKISGKSIFDCASMCVTDLTDCSAFEFCFNSDTKLQQTGALQSCEFVQGRLSQTELVDLSAVVDESSNDNLVEAGKLLVSSPNCHVYSMRRDSTEAQLRDLAISAETLHDRTEAKRSAANLSKGLTFGSGLLLFVAVALVSSAIGAGLCYAKNNEFVRHRVERARILIGV